MKIYHGQGFHIVLGFILGCLATFGIALIGWDTLFLNIKFTDFLNLIVTCILGFSINATLNRRIGHEMKLADSVAGTLDSTRSMAIELTKKSLELINENGQGQVLQNEILALSRTLNNQIYDLCLFSEKLPQTLCILRGVELQRTFLNLKQACTDWPFSSMDESHKIAAKAEIEKALEKLSRVQFRMKLEILGGSALEKIDP